MNDELVHCVTCGEAFGSVAVFEVHMVANHGSASARATMDAPRIRMLDLPDDDDDDDDDEENGEFFPLHPEHLALMIERYRARAEKAIEGCCPRELDEIHDRLGILESELLRRASAACNQTALVGELRRMVEFVMRYDRKLAG